MAKKEDKEAISSLIIILAKANNWQSREDLKEKTSKPIKTISQYLHKYIPNLIEEKGFIEKRHRRTGEADTLVKKYKLKNGLDNLLAVFDYLDNKKYQKEILQTVYFMSLIPDIETKIKSFTKQPGINKHLKAVLRKTSYYSPSAVEFLIKLNKESLRKIESSAPTIIQKKVSKSAFLIEALKGLYYADVVTGNITDLEINQFVTSALSDLTKSQI